MSQIIGLPSGVEQKRIEEELLKELRESFKTNEVADGTPMWMNVLFLLKRFNEGNFYGTISVKILGSRVNDARETERTHRLLERFNDLLD